MLMRCGSCNRYTMEAQCPLCGGPVERRAPARYSPQARYGRYRRKLMDGALREGEGTAE
jgi:H/ACA ribonucleoprotein complex subunit 3